MAGKKTGKRLLTWVLVLVMALSLLPLNALAALNTGHKIDVRFTVLYVGDEFNIGYNYGTSENTQFVCQYATNHSDTAYNNHTIAISDIKAAAGRASVNSGYQIVGWSKESNANPKTWSLNMSGTTACNKGTTIYLVAKNPNPITKYTYTLAYDANGGTGAPSADSWSTTDSAIRTHTFDIKNTVPTRDGYVFKGWKANDGSDTIYHSDRTKGTTTCAVSQYGNDVVPNGNTWTRTLYAVWGEDAPVDPAKPSEDAIKNLLGDNVVTVDCINTSVNHADQTYPLLDGSFTVGDVQGSAGSYTCTVTVNAAKYVGEYNKTISGHSLSTTDTTPKSITLTYNDIKWVAPTDTPIVFKVVCDATPDDPKVGDNFDFSKDIVDVICETTDNHNASYGLMNDYYTVSDKNQLTNGNWKCTITIDLAKYFELYNSDSQHPGHTRDMDHKYATSIMTISPTWYASTKKWSSAESLIDAAKIYVKCDATPTEPSKKDIKELLGSNAVQIICTNVESGHGSETFGLIDGTFSIVHSGYNCEVKIDSFNEYVEEFNTELNVAQGTHFSDTSKADQSIINLRWVNGKWTVMDAPAKHHVLCVTPKYTVTYTDGVDNEEVFADQVYGNLSSGIDTPAFNGTPTRTDYVFAGWKPEVAEKVTENATYAAQWKEDKNNNGIPDENEDKYTVTYTDGVNNEEVFADQVYGNLLSGTTTPAFNGTPTRTGYRFAGWNPAVADNVTESVTYAAQWTPRTDLSYTVHYYLKNTTKQVADDKTVNGQTFNADVTEKAIRISGYRVYGDNVKSITIGTGTNEIIFYYTRASRPSASSTSKPTLNTGDHYAYVMGYPDGTVRPNGSITRAEVSTILFRLLSDKTRDEYFTTESSFTDVKAGAWYNNSIATLEKAGVIVDTAKGGAFRPNEAITRAELAAMLAQFSDAKPVKGVKFSDVSAEHWAYEAIAIAAKMGWIEGYPDGTFRPDATITRAEMMTLVNRALERVPSDEDHLLSKRVMLTFPDCKSGDWFYIAVQEATNSHTYERAATEKNGDEQWTALRANRDWTQLEK